MGRSRLVLVFIATSTAFFLTILTAGCTYQRGGGAFSTASPAASAVKLTGRPIVVGFVTMENSPLGSFPETRVGAEAGVTYVNDSLGGVAGRPIVLKTCAADGSPESSQACAQRLIADRPVAVVGGVDYNAGSALPLYTTAGIPYVGGSPQLSDELTDADSYALTGGTVSELLGIVDYLTRVRHVRSVHALYVDLPGLLSAAVQASGQILRGKGVTDVALVAEKTDAADFAPAVTRVAAGHPDAIVVVFPTQSCARIMAAAAAIRVTTPIYYPGGCASAAAVRAAGSGPPSYFASGYLPVTATGGDAAAAGYRAGVPSAARSPLSQASFSTVVALRLLLAGSLAARPGATPTAAGLRTALATVHNEPNAMAHPFSCDHKQITLFPSVCDTAVRMVRWDGSGFTDVTGTWLDGSSLVSLVH